MNRDLGNYRKSYQKGNLLEDMIPDSATELFDLWFAEAETFATESGIDFEPNAMVLSTISKEGFPKGRVVLLKAYSMQPPVLKDLKIGVGFL
ncbi:MAG: hypothetical protein C4K58_02665 [Flavobacteriaceae bacterium]|nr:MAG: hypothetical protein C4K58_02665 [Flavobacteriaceae bacterium]